ncbi:hypothetical protein BH11ACT5_BH11ACT5_16650 [soil metagenome]
MRVPAALIAAAVLVGALSSPAQASEGSVPVEVAAFATAPDGLIASLADFFGPGADGPGIDFDDTTEIGAVDRVFTFSPDWLAGEKTDDPVVLANQWTAPVSVGGTPLGVAVIWINPTTVRPQLADFVPDPSFATALADVPAEAWLVADQPRGAWLVLAPPSLTALVVGTSGLSGETPLSSYQRDVTAAEPVPVEAPNLGSALSIATIVGVALIVVLALLVPLVWRRRKARATDADEAEVAGHPEIT